MKLYTNFTDKKIICPLCDYEGLRKEFTLGCYFMGDEIRQKYIDDGKPDPFHWDIWCPKCRKRFSLGINNNKKLIYPSKERIEEFKRKIQEMEMNND